MPLRSFSPSHERFAHVALPCAVGFLGLLSCFLWLERVPLHLSDESPHAVNAWEMLHGGDWFNDSFGGEPDRCNAKSQRLVWLQALGYVGLGPRELPVRWPSAASALARSSSLETQTVPVRPASAPVRCLRAACGPADPPW